MNNENDIRDSYFRNLDLIEGSMSTPVNNCQEKDTNNIEEKNTKEKRTHQIILTKEKILIKNYLIL